MKKHLQSLEFQKEIVALFLSVTLLVTTYSVLGGGIVKVLIFAALGIIVSIPIFLFLSFVRRSGLLWGIVCAIVYVICLFGLMAMSISGYVESGVSFVEWLVTRGEDIESANIHTLTLLFGGSLFFGTVTYYFAVTRYRIAILTLASLIPCVVYAKAIADVNNWYLIAIALLNIFVAVLQARDKNLLSTEKNRVERKFFSKPDLKEQYTGKMSLQGVITALSFIAIVMLLGAVIPKKSDAKYYDIFEDTFLGGDTTSDVSGIASDLMDFSGDADGFRNIGNRRLYSISGDKVTYLKRQHFDVYDFEKDYWTPIEKYSELNVDYDSWGDKAESLNLEKLRYGIIIASKLSEDFAEKYDLEWIDNTSDVAVRQKHSKITALNFEAAYLLAPEGTISINCQDYSGYSNSWGGTFYREGGKAPGDYEYDIFFIGDNAQKIAWCMQGGANLSENNMEEFLTDAHEVLLEEILRAVSAGENVSDKEDEYNKTYEAYNAVEAYLYELLEAREYREAVSDNTESIPQEIIDLAKEITSGCIYDHEKAAVLSTYFSNENFVYDLGYRAPDKSVEYFLFESKRGTCSDFATAYTLMARSVGLSVRYTEGYVAESSGRDRLYYVKESDSHAYPETYISGAGWIIYEPTSGLIEESSDGFLGAIFSNINMDPRLILSISICIGIVAAVFVMIRLVIPFAIEGILVIRILLGKISINYIYLRIRSNVIYGKLRKKYRKKNLLNSDSIGYTPAEICDVFASFEVDISRITEMVESLSYTKRSVGTLREISVKERLLIAKQYVRAMNLFIR